MADKPQSVSNSDLEGGARSPNPTSLPEAAAIRNAPSAVGGVAVDAGLKQLEDEHINTDERDLGEWRSRYPDEARCAIRLDALYVAIVFLLTLGAIFATWRGFSFEWLAAQCQSCSRLGFDRYVYFYLGGQLGGTLFGIKYLYQVVARGRWNIDRRLWRIFSPFLSGGLAFAVGTLTESGLLGLTTKVSSGAAYFSLGFITGYFADSALRKMQQIADTIFGSPETHGRQPPAGSKK